MPPALYRIQALPVIPSLDLAQTQPGGGSSGFQTGFQLGLAWTSGGAAALAGTRKQNEGASVGTQAERAEEANALKAECLTVWRDALAHALADDPAFDAQLLSVAR